ncbi:MAG: class I SAM-dependent methyltransferase [Ignavibacteriales bacterium]|nr:class I SAM-dependent methyltransferase [Ignavibacteriales bacterium]
MSEMKDSWKDGSTYEDFMGRWSRQLAPKFVAWLGLPVGGHWLDVGCGTGALTESICLHADPASVLGCDPSAPFVEYANQHSRYKQATFKVHSVGSLPTRVGGYSCVTSLLALNFFSDVEASVREMRSLVRQGGNVSACVWDYAGKMEFLRYFWDAVVAENPHARNKDEGVRFPICNPKALTQLFGAAGLDDIVCEAIEIPTKFDNFDDYWQPFLAGTGPAASYVASLNHSQRGDLVRNLKQNLPMNEMSKIALVARAWAVRGTVS